MAWVRQGRDDAFEVIYDRYHRGLLSFCRHMLGNPDEAEDAVQQTFVSAYRSLTASDRPVLLRPWLYTIARNRCLSMLRARRPGVALEDAEPHTEGLAEEVQRREDLRDLVGDLRRLPDEQRAALLLAELGAHPHEEISAILGVRREKVKALVFQARETLANERRARSLPCDTIRRELSVATGAALRRAPLRRHIAQCPGCQSFSEEVGRQRAAMALILPVLPSLGLRHEILASAFTAGHAGAMSGAAAGGSGAGAAATNGATAAGGSGAAAGTNGAAAAGGSGAAAATNGAAAGGSGAAAGASGAGVAATNGAAAGAGGGGLVALAGKGLATKVLVGAAVLGGVGGASYLGVRASGRSIDSARASAGHPARKSGSQATIGFPPAVEFGQAPGPRPGAPPFAGSGASSVVAERGPTRARYGVHRAAAERRALRRRESRRRHLRAASERRAARRHRGARRHGRSPGPGRLHHGRPVGIAPGPGAHAPLGSSGATGAGPGPGRSRPSSGVGGHHHGGHAHHGGAPTGRGSQGGSSDQGSAGGQGNQGGPGDGNAQGRPGTPRDRGHQGAHGGGQGGGGQGGGGQGGRGDQGGGGGPGGGGQGGGGQGGGGQGGGGQGGGGQGGGGQGGGP